MLKQDTIALGRGLAHVGMCSNSKTARLEVTKMGAFPIQLPKLEREDEEGLVSKRVYLVVMGWVSSSCCCWLDCEIDASLS